MGEEKYTIHARCLADPFDLCHWCHEDLRKWLTAKWNAALIVPSSQPTPGKK